MGGILARPPQLTQTHHQSDAHTAFSDLIKPQMGCGAKTPIGEVKELFVTTAVAARTRRTLRVRSFFSARPSGLHGLLEPDHGVVEFAFLLQNQPEMRVSYSQIGR